jgi:hypothetical protein
MQPYKGWVRVTRFARQTVHKHTRNESALHSSLARQYTCIQRMGQRYTVRSPDSTHAYKEWFSVTQFARYTVHKHTRNKSALHSSLAIRYTSIQEMSQSYTVRSPYGTQAYKKWVSVTQFARQTVHMHTKNGSALHSSLAIRYTCIRNVSVHISLARLYTRIQGVSTTLLTHQKRQINGSTNYTISSIFRVKRSCTLPVTTCKQVIINTSITIGNTRSL